MAHTPSNQSHHASFESIRREDEHGYEYWSARELAPLLEYQNAKFCAGHRQGEAGL